MLPLVYAIKSKSSSVIARFTPFITWMENESSTSGTMSPITFVRWLRMLRAAKLEV